MRLLLLHFGDLHLKDRNDAFSVNVNKIIQSLNEIEAADECAIALSGDLAFSGKQEEYRAMSSLLGAILRDLSRYKFKNKNIKVFCVPGNHDIDFPEEERDFIQIASDVEKKNADNLIKNDVKSMKSFYDFAYHYECFKDNDIISKRVIDYSGKKLGIVMINSAPLSFKGGDAIDMGVHYLSDKQLNELDKATEANINILILHHSLEWFSSDCKEKLRAIIQRKYPLVLTGHEHEAVGENVTYQKTGQTHFIQGNAMLGYSSHGNGFCALNLDLDNDNITAYSFIWKNDIFIPEKILEGDIKHTFRGDIFPNREYAESLKHDNNRYLIDDYFVFPSFTYRELYKDEATEPKEYDDEESFIKVFDEVKRIYVYGSRKSGKTVLAKRLYRRLAETGRYPLYFSADDLSNKKINKIIKYAFEDQYDTTDNGFNKFVQKDKAEKVAILDEAELIDHDTLNRILNYFKSEFGAIYVFSEERLKTNIYEQVLDTFTEEKTAEIRIMPFWYTKRKRLIKNVMLMQSEPSKDIDNQVIKVNDLINTQIKYFNLNPEFIISFVNQYLSDCRVQFTTGTNAFSVVYETSIRTRIINSAKGVDATLVLNVLRELAYYMHFEKKANISIEEIEAIVCTYKKDYRQQINTREFLNVVLKAKILVEHNSSYKFKDHTLIAYFVAQAINQKYNQEENIKKNIDHLLKNLCFSINSDIILFLALITNNPKFINIIVDGAVKHFQGMDELIFDNENIGFLTHIDMTVKNTFPTKEERENREKSIAKQEENAKLSDVIELVDEYNYTDDDLSKIENQIMISLKYIEILSKALPAFCNNMKAAQQDELVKLIYQCPNQLLYSVLKDINDNFEEFVNGLYTEVSELRKQRGVADVSVESIKRLIENFSYYLIIRLYQIVSDLAACEQTITALNAFNWKENSNYEIMNLFMVSKNCDVSLFSRRALEMDKRLNKKIEKSIIKQSVRNYFLKNSVELYGEGQKLFSYFFKNDDNKKIQVEMIKKRLTTKDRI